MEPIHAIIYGIVEGVTEFLPISSTGHLMLTSALLHDGADTFMKSFEIVIQLGAILAVVFLYPKRLLVERRMQRQILIAFLPTAVLGLICYKAIKTYLLGNTAIVLASLAIGGLIIMLIEKLWRGPVHHVTIEELSPKRLALIGVIQALAFIPGVSRSGATIYGGMFLGLTRKDAVEFSFLLAVPTMAAATGLDLLKNWKLLLDPTHAQFLLIGFAASFVVAMLVVRWLSRFVEKNGLFYFGVYRIVIAAVGTYIFFL